MCRTFVVFVVFLLTKNSDFVELQIDFLEDLGLYVDNLRFVRQENCDDGIGRPDCDANLEVANDIINENSEISSFDFEDLLVGVEDFFQTSIDHLFNMFH